MTLWESLVLFGSALAAGAINAVAGGGTLLTFPALLFSGVGSVVANATSSFALTAGTAGSLFGFRNQWASTRVWLRRFVPVSIAGSLLGSWLVRRQGEAVFDRVVPWLILFATGLFLIQAPLKTWREARIRALALTDAGGHAGTAEQAGGLSVRTCIVLQGIVAVYGGYFGAGIGILMLAVMGFMGMSDIHRMNALKNLLAAVINGTAAVYFAFTGLVDWPRMFVMLIGALMGYWFGAHYSQKIPAAAVRHIVIAVGLTMSAAMFWKLLRP